MFHFSSLPAFVAWTRRWWHRCASRLQIREARCSCPRQLWVPSVPSPALPCLGRSLVWDRTLGSLGQPSAVARCCLTCLPVRKTQEAQVQSLGQGGPWRRRWQPTAVCLSGESHGQRSLAGYSPWGRKESGTTSHTHSPQLWVGVQSQGHLRQRTELGHSGKCLVWPLTWSQSKCSINDHFNSSSSPCAQHPPCFVFVVL